MDAVQDEARKLGIQFDLEAAGARDALAESLKAY
jgi:hypothetical protein